MPEPQTITENVLRRFWSHVNKTDTCWLWTGGRQTSGYGAIFTGSNNSRAHRISWVIHRGPIPKGMYVLHHCDVKLCIRPDHLFIGDADTNAIDARDKHRHSHGSKHGMASITEADVYTIWNYLASGNFTQRNIARRFGISPSAISDIIAGRTWSHVPRQTIASKRRL